MKIEAERLGKDGKGLSLGLDVIERIYGINQKSGNGSSDDFAWVEENFRRISGRQIRTESQVDADNRTEAVRKKAKQLSESGSRSSSDGQYDLTRRLGEFDASKLNRLSAQRNNVQPILT